MADLPHRCSFHRYRQDEHGYRTGEWKPFPECLEAASHYTAVEVRTGEFPAEQYVNLCTPHEVEVRSTTGWKWSRPKEIVNG